MSVIAFASAKGSPGVTTTALALAAVWPRRVLVAECDPAGGDLAAWFERPPTPGLLTLGAAARRGLTAGEVWAHVQEIPDSLAALVGLVKADQAGALTALWRELPAALAAIDADVLADCGRLDPASPAMELIRAADLVVLVARPTAAGIVHSASGVETLGRAGVEAAVVLVGERPYPPAEVRDALANAGLRAEILGSLSHDPQAAARLAGAPGSNRSLRRSLLIRSARAVAEAIEAHLSATADMDAMGRSRSEQSEEVGA